MTDSSFIYELSTKAWKTEKNPNKKSYQVLNLFEVEFLSQDTPLQGISANKDTQQSFLNSVIYVECKFL